MDYDKVRIIEGLDGCIERIREVQENLRNNEKEGNWQKLNSISVSIGKISEVELERQR